MKLESEYRNPKQIRITKGRNSQTAESTVLNIGILDLELVSNLLSQ